MDRRIANIVRQCWPKPDRRHLFDWARDNVVLAGAFQKPGRLNLSPSPWLYGPATSLLDFRIQRVNQLAGVQTFKSGLGEVYNMYRIKEDPAQIMHNFQTDDVSKKIGRTRIFPTMEASPATRDIMPQARTDKSRNVYKFPGCDYTLQGGGHNESNLQSISYQVIINDEVWLYDDGNIAEAEARSDAFGKMRKILNVSQGSEVETEWERVFNAGQVFDLVVKCPSCKKMHPLLWSYKMTDGSWGGVVWERQKYLDGTPNRERAIRTVHYRCPLCGFHHSGGEVAMRKLIKTCDYSRDYPEAGFGRYDLSPGRSIERKGIDSTHSFHWNSLVSVPLEQLVDDWLIADHAHKLGDISAKKTFYQKKLAIFWSDDLETDKTVLQLSGYSMGETYHGETHRFITADYQEGRGDDTPHFWVVCRAHIKGMGASGLIWTGRVEGEMELVAKQRELGVKPENVTLDGGDKMRMIAAVCGRHGWSFALGSEKESFTHVNKRSRIASQRPYSVVQYFDVNKGKGRAKLVRYITWSNPTIKDMLSRLRDGKGVPWELPNDLPEWYEDQIDSEFRKRRSVKGKWSHQWLPKSKGNPNNHIWDCECMQLVRALVAGLIPFDADMTPIDSGEKVEVASASKSRKKSKANDDSQLLLLGEEDNEGNHD